jgi:hypothetical protein
MQRTRQCAGGLTLVSSTTTGGHSNTNMVSTVRVKQSWFANVAIYRGSDVLVSQMGRQAHRVSGTWLMDTIHRDITGESVVRLAD